jgi:thermostable 8-oxoguanine DNA glycosylase
MEQKYNIFDPNKDTLNFAFKYNNEETEDLHKIINGKPDLNIDDFRRISLWKLDRVLRLSNNTIEKLNIISIKQDLNIDDELVKEVIKELVDSDGVGYPMASAFLKFIRPDIFPIIDVRAYRALRGIKIYYSMYKYEIYIKYTKDLMKIAKKFNRPLNEVDEQLYCYDKEYNKNI